MYVYIYAYNSYFLLTSSNSHLYFNCYLFQGYLYRHMPTAFMFYMSHLACYLVWGAVSVIVHRC